MKKFVFFFTLALLLQSNSTQTSTSEIVDIQQSSCAIYNQLYQSVIIMRKPTTASEWALLCSNPKLTAELLKPAIIDANKTTKVNVKPYLNSATNTVQIIIKIDKKIHALDIPAEQLIGRTINLATLLFVLTNAKTQQGLDVISIENNTAYPLTITNHRDTPYITQTTECKPGEFGRMGAAYHAETDDQPAYRTGTIQLSNGYESVQVPYSCRIFTPHGITTTEIRMGYLDAQTLLAMRNVTNSKLAPTQSSQLASALKSLALITASLS